MLFWLICVAQDSSSVVSTSDPNKAILYRQHKVILIPKLVAMATFLSTTGLPSCAWFLRPIWSHNPNGILIGSAFWHRWPHSISILYNGTPHSPSKLPLPMRDLDPHLTHGFLGPPSPQPKWHLNWFRRFLQGSLVWQTDTWYGGRPRPRRLCVRWGPTSPLQKGGRAPIFGPCLLGPNGCIPLGTRYALA